MLLRTCVYVFLRYAQAAIKVAISKLELSAEHNEVVSVVVVIRRDFADVEEVVALVGSRKSDRCLEESKCRQMHARLWWSKRMNCLLVLLPL